MPILACQLPAHHHLGKHVHRALSNQLHPWVGARHVPQLLSGLPGPPSSFVLTPYHVPHPSLSSQLQKSLLCSQQPPPLPRHALLLCSAISELLKAGSRQQAACVAGSVCTVPVEAFTVQVYLLGQKAWQLPAVPPSPSKDKHPFYSVTLLPDHSE